MSVDLVRLEDGERLVLSNQQWAFILLCAERHGWIPKGTSKYDDNAEPIKTWDLSDYSSNEGQVVDDEDSENIYIACKLADDEEHTSSWEKDTLQNFLSFVAVENDAETLYPGFEIW